MFIQTGEYDYLQIKYPHITKKIMLYWGSRDMNLFFCDLLYNIRQGERIGFPIYDAHCIKCLFELHKKSFPQFVNIECIEKRRNNETRREKESEKD